MKNRIICFALIIQFILCGSVLATVRFAQVTDLHIFEDSRRASETKISASDFDISIKKINQISQELKATARGSLDFVLLSGDIGIGKLLKLVPLEEGEKGVTIEKDGRIYKLTQDLEKWNKAKKSIANIMQESKVKKWLIVPGNNDLYDEQPDSIVYFAQFIKELQDMPEIRAAGLSIVDFRLGSSQKAQPQSPPGMYVIDDFLFVGWDNSFFKNNNSIKRYIGTDHKLIPMVKTSENMSIQKLSQALRTSRVKYAYVFFHIPEIDDPYMLTFDQKESGNIVSKRMNEAESLSPPLAKGLYAYSAWTVPLEIRHAWENLVTNKTFQSPRIRGLFAGHFHDHKKETYESNLWVKTKRYKPDILKKLYIAPPVSVKNQTNYLPSDRAIGGQIITIDDNGQVFRDLFWFG